MGKSVEKKPLFGFVEEWLTEQ